MSYKNQYKGEYRPFPTGGIKDKDLLSFIKHLEAQTRVLEADRVREFQAIQKSTTDSPVVRTSTSSGGSSSSSSGSLLVRNILGDIVVDPTTDLRFDEDDGFAVSDLGGGISKIDFSTTLLSSPHTDTLASTVVRGGIIVANSTPKWSQLAIGASSTFLRSNGTDPSWTAITAADLPKANLVGTTNQVNLSASGTGVLVGSTNITLSLPQNIHTAASPTFAGATFTGGVVTIDVLGGSTLVINDITHNLLYVNGSGVVNGIGYGGTTSVLQGQGLTTPPQFTSGPTVNTLTIVTGSTLSFMTHALANYSGTGVMSEISHVAIGSVLISQGTTTPPIWSTDIATGVTIGTAYIYRVGGTDVAIADGGTGASTALAGFNALSPLTTKGDILTRDATDNIRVAVGTDGWVLTADSAQASGIKWAAVSGGSAHDVLSATHTDTLADTVVLGDILHGNVTPKWARLAGNITTTRKFLRQTGSGAVSAVPAWDTILATDIPSSALTKTDDTNVTLTLGGTPTTALLAATSLTLGWTGLLSLARGGTNENLTASNGGIFYSTATAGAILAGTATAGLALVSGASTTPSWFAPTAGSVLFAGVGGILQQDNTKLFWDDSRNILLHGLNAYTDMYVGYAAQNNTLMEISYSTATASSTPFTGLMISKNLTGTSNIIGGLYFVNSSLGAVDKRLAQISVNTDGATNSGAILFLTNSAGTVAERMRITSAGLVGIGVTPTARLHVVQAVATTGSPTALLVVGGAHTTLTASTECLGVNLDFSATKQFAAGSLTTQREILIKAPTYGFVTASTITTASTLEINNAPAPGTNCTITTGVGIHANLNQTVVGTITNLHAIRAVALISNANTLTTVAGLYARIGTSSASSTITTGYTLYADNPSEAGTMTTYYGLYVAGDASSASAQYSYIGTRLGLCNNATPSAALHIGLLSTYGHLRMDGIAGNPGTPTAGDHWYNTTQKSHRLRATSGTAGLVGLLYANTTDSNTVTNTTTETDFNTTYSLPANALTVGKCVRIRCTGKFAQLSGTLTLKFYIGANVHLTTNALTLTPSSTEFWHYEGTFIVRSVGAGGTLLGQGISIMGTNRSQIAHSDASGSGSATTIDTTASATVKCSAQFGTANAANSITLQNITIEVLD